MRGFFSLLATTQPKPPAPVAASSPPSGGSSVVPGKTLRDEFAMAALTGLLAGVYTSRDDPQIAAYAYDLADAMLKARLP